MLATDIIAALDAFLEAVAPVQRQRHLAPLIDRATVRLGTAFATQGRLLLERFAKLNGGLREADDSADPTDGADAGTVDSGLDAFDEVAFLTAHLLSDPIDELAGAALDAGATEQVVSLGLDLSFDLANPRAVQYLLKYGADRVTQIDQTTRDQLRTLLADGVEQGLSYTEMASQITQLFSQFSTDRALLIATTESGNAYSAGSLLVGQDLQSGGLEIEKSWNTVGDDRVDPDLCGPNEAQGWIPLDDAFQSGDDRPLGHPRCRCYLSLRRVGAGD